MAKVESFEELNVWKAARALAQEVYTHLVSNERVRDYPLKDQINRSSGSIMDNIAEGFGRQGNKELRQFLGISRGSCEEVKSQLYRARDRDYLDQPTFNKLINSTTEISKMISGFIKYLNSSGYKGSKFLKEPELKYEVESKSEH